MKKFRFSRKILGIPYAAFLFVFVAAPLAVLFYYAFTDGNGNPTFSNLVGFFANANTLGTLFYSFAVALVTTAVCLLIAYPTAYILANSRLKNRSALLLLFIMPMWINFSLRITALKEILTVIEGNLSFYPFLNAVVGMSYDFLPFMILPIYNTLFKAGRLSGRGCQGSGRGWEKRVSAGSAAVVCAGNYQRCIHGVFAGYDQLCGAGYAL